MCVRECEWPRASKTASFSGAQRRAPPLFTFCIYNGAPSNLLTLPPVVVLFVFFFFFFFCCSFRVFCVFVVVLLFCFVRVCVCVWTQSVGFILTWINLISV